MLTQHRLLMLKDKKTTTAHREEHSDEASGDELADSADSGVLLRATRALREPALLKSLSEVEDPSTSFLGNISQDYDAEEKTSEAVTAKLAEFVNKRFSAKLGDGKCKEKLEKYGRPSNCDKVAVPAVNPKIWDKLTHQAKRRDLRVAAIQKTVMKVGAILTGSASKIMATLADSKNSNITSNLEELLTFSTLHNSIALLGHSNQNLSQHRRDLIRPFLNKEYSALCSPHIPITGKSFGDELQSQLNGIKASNKMLCNMVNQRLLYSQMPRLVDGEACWAPPPLGGLGAQVKLSTTSITLRCQLYISP